MLRHMVGILMKTIKFFLIFLPVLVISCSKFKNNDDENPYQNVPPNKLYAEAKKDLKRKQYESASKKLEAMEVMYPFSENSQDAELELIYAYYKNGDYASSAATAERYIHLYPRAKNVDYAYYMKGVANFQQPRGTMSNLFPIDESWRDPGTQTQAYSDFATLVQLFPKSKYAENAKQRMIYLRNLFAQKEVNVSKYYYERKMFVAAIERANYAIKTYPQAPSTKDALAIIYNSNKQLGLSDAANDAYKVYKNTYKSEPTENITA